MERSYTTYASIADPPVEEGALHESDTCPSPEMAPRFCGAVEVVYTVASAAAVNEPLGFVAVNIYAVVEVGCTVKEPASVVVEKPPGRIATEEALLTVHESVLVAPGNNDEGVAIKEEITGGVAALNATIAVPIASPLTRLPNVLA